MKEIFKKIGHFLKRHRKFFVFAVLLVIGAGVFVYFQNKKIRLQAKLPEQVLETSPLERMTLTNYVSATGTLESAEASTVRTSLTEYEVKEVLAEVGDEVQEGDVICILDTTSLKEKISTIQKSISNAKAKSEQNLATAERKLSEAQQTQYIESKEAEDEVYTAWLKWAEANQKVDDLEAENARDEEIEQAEEAADSAHEAYKKAVMAQESTNRNNYSSVLSQQENLASEQLSAETGTTSEEEQLKEYQKDLENCTIKAPQSGIVTSVTAAQGAVLSGGEAAQIQKTDSFVVKTTIDEYEISSIEKGMGVLIKTEATGEEELKGTVTFISPVASSDSSSSDPVYEVEISVDTKNELLRLGMTAKLSIITESKENVFAVQYDAVEENEKGESIIKVVETVMPENERQSEEIPGQAKGTASKAGDEAEGETVSGSEAEAVSKSDRREGGAEGKTPDRENSAAPIQNIKEIVVEAGMETDFYIEISGEELEEGMEVVTGTQSGSGASSKQVQGSMMMMPSGGGAMPAGRH